MEHFDIYQDMLAEYGILPPPKSPPKPIPCYYPIHSATGQLLDLKPPTPPPPTHQVSRSYPRNPRHCYVTEADGTVSLEQVETPFVPTPRDYTRTCKTSKQYTPYTRMTHFKEHLKRVLCLRSQKCPEWVVNTVKTHFPAQWTEDIWYQVRAILQRHCKPAWRYYPHIFELIAKCGGPKHSVTPQQQYQLLALFKRVNSRWDQVKCRKNLPSYYTVMDILFEVVEVEKKFLLPDVLHTQKRKQCRDWIYELVD